MHRLRRFSLWIILNGGMGWLAWEGIHGNKGPGNLLIFATWMFAISQFIAAVDNNAKTKIAKKGRSAPAWLSHGIGATMIAFLVWHGWIWTAVGYLINECGEAAIFHKKENS